MSQTVTIAWPRSACARIGSGSAEGVFQPDIAAVHIGGVTNKLADWLSREAAPGGTGDRPAILQQSSETVILPQVAFDFLALT